MSLYEVLIMFKTVLCIFGNNRINYCIHILCFLTDFIKMSQLDVTSPFIRLRVSTCPFCCCVINVKNYVCILYKTLLPISLFENI